MKSGLVLPLIAASLAAGVGAVRADPIFGVVDSPLDMRTDVIWSDSSGATLHSEVQSATGTISGPKQSAEILYEEPLLGVNTTPRGSGVRPAFASALAESDGNGGVGVSALKFSPALGLGAFDQLVSQASWEQTFEDVNGFGSQVTLHLSIPEMVVALQGVAPMRARENKIETALAQVDLTTVIHRADHSVEAGGTFEFGMHADEYQILLGPNTFANFADITFVGSPPSAPHFFDDPGTPTWVLDAFSKDLVLGTLDPGDTLTYTYQIVVRGRTNGAERGFFAFVGDPFGADVVGANLVATIAPAIAPVPEPPLWALLVAGLGVGARCRRRRGA